MAQFADCTIPVVGDGLDENSHTRRSVTLKSDFFKRLAFEPAGAAQNRSFNIWISRIRRVKILPRLASVAAFLCLIVAHFE